MLRLSRKLDYAILAVAHLSAPDLEGQVSARSLSERCRIPGAVLANILKELGRAGIVRSVRGVHGGYELAVPPESLSIGELVRRLEGPTRLVECVSLPGDGGVSTACDLEQKCAVKSPLRKLHHRIQDVLDEMTFDQLAVEVFAGAGSTRETESP